MITRISLYICECEWRARFFISTFSFSYHSLSLSHTCHFMLSDTVVDVVIPAFISIRRETHTKKKINKIRLRVCVNVFVAIFLRHFFFHRAQTILFFKKKLNIFAEYRTLCDQQADDESLCTHKRRMRPKKTTASTMRKNKLPREQTQTQWIKLSFSWKCLLDLFFTCDTHTTGKATATNWEIKGTKESKSDSKREKEWQQRVKIANDPFFAVVRILFHFILMAHKHHCTVFFFHWCLDAFADLAKVDLLSANDWSQINLSRKKIIFFSSVSVQKK